MGPKDLAKNKPINMKVFCVCENRWMENPCRRCADAPSCAFVNEKIAGELAKEAEGKLPRMEKPRQAHPPEAKQRAAEDNEKKDGKHRKQA